MNKIIKISLKDINGEEKSFKGKIALPDIYICYKASKSKKMCVLVHELTSQWNRVSSEIDSITYRNLAYDKGGLLNCWVKDTLLNKSCWHNYQLFGKR